MCVLCGYLVTDLHWTEARFDQDGVGSAAHETPRRRQRLARIRIVDRVLRHYGLGVHDDWGATSYVVSNRKGASQLVEHLGQLWPAAERLAGQPLDPLDEGLLEDLAGG
ncbi:MAG TPA: hypothetical protein VFD01_20090 [Candidatus Dormibacteraeota bacterium]|nr:hypothetical protein [Candidatus Dormibacteraeota bacterium]